MNAQDLKNSILQLAIQGKLVEQREEEGTAKELFNQIQEEKRQLIEEGKIKKTKKLPEIVEDEKPFDIPESWKWLRHNELFEIIGGSQPPKSYFREQELYGYIRLYQIRDYGNKPAPIFVPKNKVSKFSQKGDILLARYGASVGKVFIAKEGAYNVAMAKSTPLFSSDLVNNKYLYFFYLAPLYQTLVKNNSRSAQAGFNKKDLDVLLFPLPPLEEQKRIVAKIEELMPYVDKYDVAYSEVEELNKKFPEDMQKSILQYAMQGKLVEQREEDGTAEDLYKQIQEEKKKLIKKGKIKKTKALPEVAEDEIPYDIPENWKWVKLGDLFEITMGQSPKGANVFEDEFEGGIEFHQGKVCFGEDSLEISNKYTNKPTKIVRPNTILLCVRAPVGIVNITDREICIGRGLSGINTFCGMDAKFVLHALRAFKNDFINKATGSTFVAINGEVVKNQLFPLPPLNEQKRIVEKIEEILPRCKQLIK